MRRDQNKGLTYGFSDEMAAGTESSDHNFLDPILRHIIALDLLQERFPRAYMPTTWLTEARAGWVGRHLVCTVYLG